MSSCLIHVAHNSFLKGLKCLNIDIDDFIVKLFTFFHHQHLRTENYEKIQAFMDLPDHAFIKHCATRWLTVGPAYERALEQLPALTEYFLTYIPNNEKDTIKNKKYLDIVSYLKNPSLKAVLEFVAFLAKIFMHEFTGKMQKK